MARLITAIRLSGYGAAYFFAAGAFMSYWPVWLRDRGVQDAEIGTLFMSRQIVSVGSTLLIGWMAHRLGTLRVWGSVAFILGVVVCGQAVDRSGPAWVLHVGLSGVVLLVPLALCLPK